MKLDVTCPLCGDPIECEIALKVGGDTKNAARSDKGGIYVNVETELVSGPAEHFADCHGITKDALGGSILGEALKDNPEGVYIAPKLGIGNLGD